MMRARSLLLLVIPAMLSLKTQALGRSNFYSSSLRTQALLQTHNELLSAIQEYATAVKEVSTILNRYTSESEIQAMSEPWTSNGDPLKTYLLIRRTTVDLDSIVDAVRKIRSLDPLLEIGNLRRKELLPDLDDFEGVAKSLIRLQKMYLLQPKDLVDGKIVDIESPVKLTASDCLRIGEVSETVTADKTIPVDARMWYSAGIGLTQNNSELVSTEQLLQDRQKAIKERTEKFLVTPEEFQDFNKEIFNTTMDSSTAWPYVEMIGRRLCRGETIRSPSMDVGNFCHLSRGPHPYMKLRPLKVEVKNYDPYLVVLHDIVGNNEIEKLKEGANLKNEPSMHVLPNASTGTTDVRVSVTSWLSDTYTPSLTKRIEVFLGLNSNATLWDVEDYQVLNYGIGGHYSLHRDYFEDSLSDNRLNTSGNRIATLMFYLNDVEKGGYTVFPYIGQALTPIKGAAAFWWNLRSGGDGDFKTTHGACPVIYGTKWVANKWFRERNQMFRMPCGLEPNEVVGYL